MVDRSAHDNESGVAVIAVVFDFDDTLVPDATTALLASRGIDVDEFWSEVVPPLVEEGYDPPLAYLRAMLDRIGADLPLGLLSSRDLREFGESLDSEFFPGLPALFADLRDLVGRFRDISIEFYIVSGGLQDVIGGSSVVKTWFDGFYGCQLGEDDHGLIRYVKRCVTFTDSSRSTNGPAWGVRTMPHLVNNKVAARRVPAFGDQEDGP